MNLDFKQVPWESGFHASDKLRHTGTHYPNPNPFSSTSVVLYKAFLYNSSLQQPHSELAGAHGLDETFLNFNAQIWLKCRLHI